MVRFQAVVSFLAWLARATTAKAPQTTNEGLVHGVAIVGVAVTPDAVLREPPWRAIGAFERRARL